MADPRTGNDRIRSLHGERGVRLSRPLPPAGTVIGRNRVVNVNDKGEGRGVLVTLERDILDAATGDLLATRTSTSLLRGDDGCGVPAQAQPRPHRLPDQTHTLPTRPEAALIYRLSGDWKPIHANPAKAAKAGFDRPILHGLCTFGMIGRALIATACATDPARLREMAGRFSAPCSPGETIAVDLWDEGGGGFGFQARAAERAQVISRNSLARAA